MQRQQAWELLTKYNKDHFHLQHALTVEGVMRWPRWGFCTTWILRCGRSSTA